LEGKEEKNIEEQDEKEVIVIKSKESEGKDGDDGRKERSRPIRYF
jgi:hypothetical protein